MARAKEIAGLDCEAPAADGVQIVLRTRLEDMCALRSHALDWSDIEGVHSMRVASRRLRSALRDFQSLFRRRELRPLGKRLRIIAATLGDVRDKDVAIMAFEELAAQAPIEIAEGIRSMLAGHNLARERARVALAAAITEDALIQLQADFALGLERGVRRTLAGNGKTDKGKANKEVHAETSFREAGRRVIQMRWQELQDHSASLYHPFETDPLHELRITAKRLRYAIELFATCFGEDRLVPFAKEVAELQTSLGELHDCDVWIEWFGKRLDGSPQPGQSGVKAAGDITGAVMDISDPHRPAVIWLIDHFVKARTKHYRAALAAWHDWETNDFAARLTATLDWPSIPNATLPVKLPGNNSTPEGPRRVRVAKSVHQNEKG